MMSTSLILMLVMSFSTIFSLAASVPNENLQVAWPADNDFDSTFTPVAANECVVDAIVWSQGIASEMFLFTPRCGPDVKEQAPRPTNNPQMVSADFIKANHGSSVDYVRFLGIEQSPDLLYPWAFAAASRAEFAKGYKSSEEPLEWLRSAEGFEGKYIVGNPYVVNNSVTFSRALEFSQNKADYIPPYLFELSE